MFLMLKVRVSGKMAAFLISLSLFTYLNKLFFFSRFVGEESDKLNVCSEITFLYLDWSFCDVHWLTEPAWNLLSVSVVGFIVSIINQFPLVGVTYNMFSDFQRRWDQKTLANSSTAFKMKAVLPLAKGLLTVSPCFSITASGRKDLKDGVRRARMYQSVF